MTRSTDQLQQFYRQVFESPAGQAVLIDLDRIINQTRVTTKDFLLPNTPNALIGTVSKISDWLDRVPLVNRLAQSVFLVASRSQL